MIPPSRRRLRCWQRIGVLLIIIPDSTAPLYNRIKLYADVRYGIRTVSVAGEKFVQKGPQYFANVALKLNLKLGGTNQVIHAERQGIIGEGNTMVVGIDVTHPSPSSASNAPSIAAMVASIDKNLGQWPAVLRVQHAAREEMVSSLTEMLESRLSLWRGHNRSLPKNILVYRDGVSEGQYQLVLEKELPLLRKACQMVYSKEEQPRLTIVVVGKRHHTRFYRVGDSLTTPVPGTVVDRGVTEARNWDFFLQSHAAIKGTARPAHYFVVLDEIFRKHSLPAGCNNVADALEQLTQGLCYVYGRATKAVSVCTPAYYADIACERARLYLGNVFDTPNNSVAGSVSSHAPPVGDDDTKVHEKLKNSMFYI